MIPYASREQIAELDRLMVEHFKFPVKDMMDIAGKRLADFIKKKFPLDYEGNRKIVLCCGKGNNGGDGLAAASYLHEYGYEPKVYIITNILSEEARYYHNRIEEINSQDPEEDKIPIFMGTRRLKMEIRGSIVVDCMIGYNLRGEVERKFATVIDIINHGREIIACDIPSGIDPDKGEIYDIYVDADYILFLSLPKLGCRRLIAEKYVADIGVPIELYPMIGLEKKNPFASRKIVELS